MTDERSVVREQPERRPYCARVEIQLDPSDTFKFDGDVSLLLPVPQVIRVEAKADDHSGKVTQTLRT
ncbi:MAG TPA: hypothetical protein VLV83_21770, partial [Acidobacteriota bacterium]|nr:hypothetical protein [Acidobacteriota bacterium]